MVTLATNCVNTSHYYTCRLKTEAGGIKTENVPPITVQVFNGDGNRMFVGKSKSCI